jgi:hypothetical protein
MAMGLMMEGLAILQGIGGLPVGVDTSETLAPAVKVVSTEITNLIILDIAFT